MSCYCIGESVCYWLEKGNSMDTWRWRTTLIKSERCYWMTASLYRKYNTFSDREQQHRTMTNMTIAFQVLRLFPFVLCTLNWNKFLIQYLKTCSGSHCWSLHIKVLLRWKKSSIQFWSYLKVYRNETILILRFSIPHLVPGIFRFLKYANKMRMTSFTHID